MRIDEAELAIARVYARSLLGLAQEREAADEIGDELQALVELLDRAPAVERFLADPLIDDAGRQRALEKVFRGRLSDLLVDGLQVMNRKGRAALVRALAEAYRLQLEALHGEIDVEITTAVPLSEELRRRLTEAAARFSGLVPRLVEKVDEALLGGLVVRVGDRKIDTSVSKELRRLEARLVERASREIHGGRRFYADAEA